MKRPALILVLFVTAAAQAWAGFSSASAPGDQYCLAIVYWVGPLARNNYEESVKWLRKATDQHRVGAQATLGYFYKSGRGVKQDFTGTARWWRKATEQGNRVAMVGVGTLAQPAQPTHPHPGEQYFEEGKNLYNAKDFKAAAQEFLKAADMGNPLAQLQIGYQYEIGEGVPQSHAEAFKWYSKAATQGEVKAQNNLGQMYEEGRGVTENWVEAAKWYRKSAEQNNPNGQFSLGRAYQFGIGVPQSRSEAITWFSLAAAQGHGQADYSVRHLQSRGNFIGFRNEAEEQMVIANKLRFSLLNQEPVGVLFHNSVERNAYLAKLRRQVDQSEATAMWNTRKREYDACRRAGGSDCHHPGPPPR